MLRFAQYNSDELTFARDGVDLVISVNGESDTLTITKQFEGQIYAPGLPALEAQYGISEIVFANGEAWDLIDLAKAVETHTSGNDSIEGTRTIDFLDGGAGDDTLHGGMEGDVYAFGTGDGDDVIYDQQNYLYVDTPDIVKFKEGITLDDVTFTRNGSSSNLVVELNGTSDTLTVEGQFDAIYTGIYGTQWYTRVEGFMFDDGSSVAWTEVMERVLESGRTEGNDTIYGFNWEDVLDGGEGDDFLSGGNESDTYIFGHGYGEDTILEGRSNILSGSDDTLRFLPGVTPEEITFTRDGSSTDITINLDDDSSVTIEDQFGLIVGLGYYEFNRIENFVFVDSTEWSYEDLRQNILDYFSTSGNDTIYGFNFRDDTIIGGEGDDFMSGDLFSDTYVYNVDDGDDTINDGYDFWEADTDTLILGEGITPAMMQLERTEWHHGDLQISFDGEDGSILLKNQFFGKEGVEQIIFDDTTVWEQDDLRLAYLEQHSTSGNDTIYGFGGIADTIEGGLGNDSIDGLGGGGDTI